MKSLERCSTFCRPVTVGARVNEGRSALLRYPTVEQLPEALASRSEAVQGRRDPATTDPDSSGTSGGEKIGVAHRHCRWHRYGTDKDWLERSFTPEAS